MFICLIGNLHLDVGKVWNKVYYYYYCPFQIDTKMGSGHSGIARITSDTSTVVETRQTLKQDPDNIKSLSRFFAAKTTQRNDIAKHRYDQRKV